MNPLKTFQKKIGVTPDGIFGGVTLRAGAQFLKFNEIQAVHFFAQCAHETFEFKRFEENLNYSKDRLLQIFKFDFDQNKDGVYSEDEIQLAEALHRKPRLIANFVYANQNGNGPVQSGDGWNYRGRGAIQLTGRTNYQLFSDYKEDLAIIECPEVVADQYAFESAEYFFNANKITALCKDLSEQTIRTVTRRINGGYNGIKHRRELTIKYSKWI